MEYFHHANKRKIPFNITMEDAWSQFEIQKGICAISKVPIRLVRSLRFDRNKQTASMDRIDSKKGYTKDNIQWVHKKINIMKNTTPQSEFVEWCKKVTEASK